MQLRLTDIAAVVLMVLVLMPWGEGAARPTAPEIPAPSAEAKATVAPITRVLAGHREQAGELAAFYHAAADTLRRDGAGAKVVKTTKELRTFCEGAVTLRFQEAFQMVPGLSDAIHGSNGALATLLKLDVVELDHARAAEALDAVAWACQEAAQ